jgi:RimJ/RimL family protein N-acetyltransferase
MTSAPTIHTLRLHLRLWRDEDLPAFAALNADPRVMAFLPKPLDRAESDARAARIRDHFARHGFGLWAVEVPGVTDFIGFVGLSVPDFETRFTPCVEVGWRLAHEHWGKGYATEAARAALDFGFRRLALDEIVSYTVPANRRSRGVMERIGMTRTPADDFDHPALPERHPLRRHVLYRAIRRQEPVAESPHGAGQDVGSPEL